MDYRKIVESALAKAKDRKILKEAVLYPDGMNERMHPTLENELINQNHSLGKHPAIPEGDENTFEQMIMGERFQEVSKRYKRAFDTDNIDSNQVKRELMPLVRETMVLESQYTQQLQELAIKMIREEYDMGEDVVEIIAELVPEISIEGTKKNATPTKVEGMEFDSHDDIVNANEEVYKRRFLNAMIQGAAKKCNHMFHLVDEELLDINPKLPNKYNKVMSAADYIYYVIPKMDQAISGGVVRVEFPSKKNPKAVIHAQAMIFPVLIHEIVKGVMELLAAHGLPKNEKLANYVINKADFLSAEPWDMRLGPALWGRFTESIDADDFNLKHHVFSELASLPAKEFHRQMKEILAGTTRGKKIVSELIDNVKNDFQQENFNSAVSEMDDEDFEPFF